MLEHSAGPGSDTVHLEVACSVGAGVPRDVAKAMRRWWMAAQKGDPEAQLFLRTTGLRPGNAFFAGDGVLLSRSPERAALLISMSCTAE